MIIKDFSGLPLAQFEIFKNFKIKHCITTKNGGVSASPFATFNLALHVNDNPQSVIKNRQILCEKLDLDFNLLTTCAQVHGNNVVKVTSSNAGSGNQNINTTIPNCDALITNVKNIPLLLFFADCTPILIYDKANHAIGIAHAGWRGTVGNISSKTLLSMKEAYGTKPSNCYVVIGNSIGKCCYEIGTELANMIKEKLPNDYNSVLKFHHSKNKFHLDLWKYNELLLLEAGVPLQQIQIANVCTCCNHKQFYSYRKEQGVTGRIGALMCLE